MDTKEAVLMSEEVKNTKIGKSKKIFIIILVIAIFLVIIVSALVCYFMRVNKIGNEFANLLTKDQSIVQMVKKIEHLCDDGEHKLDIKVSNDLGEVSNFKIDFIVKDKNFDGNIKLILENEEVTLYELLRNDNIFAMNISNVNDEFVAVKNENLPELLERFGYNLESIKNSEDIEEANEFLLKLLQRYGKVLASSIGKYIKIDKDVEIEIDGEKYKTNLYRLDIDQKMVLYMYKDIINTLATDNEALAFLASYTANINGEDSETVFFELSEEINRQKFNLMFVDIESLEENEKILDIHLYANDGKTIKTELIVHDGDTEEKMSLESISNESKDFVKFTVVSLVESGITYRGVKSDENYTCEFLLDSDSEAKIKITSLNNINTSKDIRNISDVKHIMLNTATDEELSTFLQTYIGLTLEESKNIINND